MKKVLFTVLIIFLLLVGFLYMNKDPKAQFGDIINIDFVGKLDGQVFDGGSANNQIFFLGEGGYVDGFEQQIEGMKTGEKKVITIEFPQDYSSDDLAGKKCTFDITMNNIYKEVK